MFTVKFWLFGNNQFIQTHELEVVCVFPQYLPHLETSEAMTKSVRKHSFLYISPVSEYLVYIPKHFENIWWNIVQNLAFLHFGKHAKAARILIIRTCERAKALQLCPALAWPIACQAPLSMWFSRQEHWSGLPCPPAQDLPDPKTEPTSPVLAGGFFATSAPWEFLGTGNCCYMFPQVLASAELSWFNLTGKDFPGSVSGK